MLYHQYIVLKKSTDMTINLPINRELLDER
jgi:hypothetical protein